MYQIHFLDPKIKDITPIELILNDGSKAYVVSGSDLKCDLAFDTHEEYVTWMETNMLNFGKILNESI